MADDPFPITGRGLLLLRQKFVEAFGPRDPFTALCGNNVTTATLSLTVDEAKHVANLIGHNLTQGPPPWHTPSRR